MLLARQQRTHRICTPGAGSRGVFEGGVYKGSEAPSKIHVYLLQTSKVTSRKAVERSLTLTSLLITLLFSLIFNKPQTFSHSFSLFTFFSFFFNKV